MGKLITGGLGNKRQLESRAGKLMRMARMLRRKGYKQASSDFARASAEERMIEPNTKSQEYRQAEDAKRQQLNYAQALKRRKMIDRLTGDNQLPSPQQPLPTERPPAFREGPAPSPRTGARTMEFAPHSYKEDALIVIGDPNHPMHNPETVAELKARWGL